MRAVCRHRILLGLVALAPRRMCPAGSLAQKPYRPSSHVNPSPKLGIPSSVLPHCCQGAVKKYTGNPYHTEFAVKVAPLISWLTGLVSFRIRSGGWPGERGFRCFVRFVTMNSHALSIHAWWKRALRFAVDESAPLVRGVLPRWKRQCCLWSSAMAWRSRLAVTS